MHFIFIQILAYFIQLLAFPESPDGRTIAHVTEGQDLHVTQKRSRVLVSRPTDINSASFTPRRYIA